MERSELLKFAGAVIGIVLIAYGSTYALRVRREARGEAFDEESDLLEAIREAYESGEIDEEEYRKAVDSIERGGPIDRDARSGA